jgi:RNA polymerase sigma-70 factor (ECF subfamily)
MDEKTYQHLSDEALLEKLYSSNDNIWTGYLLHRYAPMLLGTAMKYLKDQEEARETVQQIFEIVLVALPKHRVTNFKGWLYRVAKNKCLRELISGIKFTSLEEKDEQLVYHEDVLKDCLETERKYEALGEALERLNSAQQQCIRLFYLEKKSYQEICDLTGMGMLAVKSNIQNGKRNLKIDMMKKLKAIA